MALNFKKRIRNLFRSSKEIDEGINTAKAKIGIWSCSGSAFHTLTPALDTVGYGFNTGKITLQEATGDAAFQTTINVPHGAVLESFQVWGSDTLEEASVYRVKNTNSTATLLKTVKIGAKGALNEIVDLDNYSYLIECSTSPIDSIYGAEVKYTY